MQGRISTFAVNNVTALTWVGFLLAWQLIGSILDPIYLSTPLAVTEAAAEQIASGRLLAATLVSLRSLAIGFVLAGLVGIPIGMLMGRSRTADHVLDIYVTSLYVTPTLALLPLLILYLGLDLATKATLVFLATVFPVILNVRQGTKDLSGSLLELGRAFLLSRWDTVRLIIAPAIMSFVAAGLRLGLGRAVGTMLVAEMVTRTEGLGALLIAFSTSLRTDRLLVPIIVLVGLGVGLSKLLTIWERRLLRHRGRA